MIHTRRILAALLAMLLLASAAIADDLTYQYNEEALFSEEGAQGIYGYSEADALAEESALDAFDAQPGDYEWYILPTEPVDGYAYVDIFPMNDVVFNEDGSWTFTFALEETTGISFQPYVLTLICFNGEEELTRTAHDIDDLTQWWRDHAVLCGSTVVYQGTISEPDITAVAISIIGLDEYGNEQEFHSLIDIRTPEEIY